MASDDTLLIFAPQDNEPPSASYATLDTRNGHPVLDFDAAADESAIFTGVLPRHYAGGAIEITLIWAATSATSGDVVWLTAVERVDTGHDIDADGFATALSNQGTAPGTSGAPIYTGCVHSASEIDGLGVGEVFRLKVTRNADDGADTMAGDAELIAIEIREY